MPLTMIGAFLAPLLLDLPCSPPTIYNSIGSGIGTAEVATIPSEQYLIVYQDIQPNSRGTTEIDVGKLLETVRSMPAVARCRWGVLDWEDPHFGAIEDQSGGDRRDRCIAELRRAIAALKSEFPRIRWTIWGAPELPFWIGGKTWDAASDETRSAAIESALARWQPVMDSCDWLMPWIYVIEDQRKLSQQDSEGSRRRHVAWAEAKVRLCREHIRRTGRMVPVLPCVCPFVAPNNGNKTGIPLSVQEFLEFQARPAFEAGAHGLCLWSALDWWLPSAFANEAAEANAEAVAAQALARESVTRAFGPADWKSVSDRVRVARAASELVLSDLRAATDLWWPRQRRR